MMRNWQVLALCFSIIISAAASTFYLKYEPKTIIESDSGTVDLGKVFAEKVMIDIVLINFDGSEEKFIEGVSFYDSSRKIAEALVDLSNERNDALPKNKRTTYDKIDNYQAGKNKFKIRTYINYLSSNFKSIPYTYVIGEETHSLQDYMPLNDIIYPIVDKNYKTKKDEVSSNLFMNKK